MEYDHRRLSGRNVGFIVGLVLLCLAFCCCCWSFLLCRRKEREHEVSSGKTGYTRGSSGKMNMSAPNVGGISTGAAAGLGAAGLGAAGLGAAFGMGGMGGKGTSAKAAMGMDGGAAGMNPDIAASDVFLKGRQAGMAAGMENEAVDAYAVGYMDGAHYAAEDPSASFTNAQVMKQAKKLGYGGESADAYVQGFQGGFGDGIEPMLPETKSAVMAGRANADARGLVGADKNAYAAGYGEGKAAGRRYDADLSPLALKHGFSSSQQVQYFSEGYDDGCDGIVMGDFYLPPAAFQKGLANGQALGLSEQECVAHATGFQHGYGFCLEGGDHNLSKKELKIKAQEADYSGDGAKHYTNGFREGMFDGNSHRAGLYNNGGEHAKTLGMSGAFANAFAAGHRDGTIDMAARLTKTQTSEIKAASKALGFGKNDTDSYIRGYKEGSNPTTTLTTSRDLATSREIRLPEAVFEDALLKSGLDEESAPAFATGRHDGYCYGLMGGSQKTDDELYQIGDKLGFQGNDVPVYADGFQSGISEGLNSRSIAHEKGTSKAVSLNMSGVDSDAYATGYRDGMTDSISGTQTKDQSEATLTKRAKKIGYTGSLPAMYVSGFQDGARDGNAQLMKGHVLSSEGAYAKGLVDAKAQGLAGDHGHAYASGYSDGYEGGLSGTEKPRDTDLFATATEQGLDGEEAQDIFAAGYNDGHDDGSDVGKRQSNKILLPAAALAAGSGVALARGLSGGDSEAFSAGYSDGYGSGVNGQQCPRDAELMGKAAKRSFISGMGGQYATGFKEGHAAGAGATSSKGAAAVSPDDLRANGLAKAQIHGMSGSTSKAYAKGYEDGYLACSTQPEGAKIEMTRPEMVEQARGLGYSDKKSIHAYVAGYLAGGAYGGASVMHHSLCDVHRCTSAYCETCRKVQNPTFLSIPLSNHQESA